MTPYLDKYMTNMRRQSVATGHVMSLFKGHFILLSFTNAREKVAVVMAI